MATAIAGDIALYVHVPFCLKKKCDYCDFFSIPAPNESLMERVTIRSLEQLDYFIEELGTTQFKSVFVGGGTPNCLPERLFRRLFEGISSRIDLRQGEWSVELNPEALTESQLDILNDSGVTRISLGVQSLDEQCLKKIGRNCTKEKAEEAIQLVKRYWSGEASADLMLGLPGQSPDSIKRDIGYIADMGFDHISLYELTLEKGTSLYELANKNPALLPSEEESTLLSDAGEGALTQKGFVQYEVSNYARDGHRCLHNLAYWGLQNYLGIGPGAVSSLFRTNGEREIDGRLKLASGDIGLRLSVKEDLDGFLSREDFGIEIERIDAQTELREWLMMGLRTTEGIDFHRYEERFSGRIGCPNTIREAIEKSLVSWSGLGLLELGSDCARLNKKGLLFHNRFLVECFEELSTKEYPTMENQ